MRCAAHAGGPGAGPRARPSIFRRRAQSATRRTAPSRPSLCATSPPALPSYDDGDAREPGVSLTEISDGAPGRRVPCGRGGECVPCGRRRRAAAGGHDAGIAGAVLAASRAAERLEPVPAGRPAGT